MDHLYAVQNVAGESPIWVPEESALYWVDCEGGSAHRAAGERGAGDFLTWAGDRPVTAIGRRARGGWIAATKQGLAFWDGASGHFDLIVDPEADRPGHRCNDAAVDRQGRLWVGTMNQEDLHAPTGALWRLDPDLSLHRIAEGFAVPNGIAFSPDDTVLYVTDMFHSKIVAYDFDAAAGTVSNPRDFVSVPAEAGLPDGLVVDAEGCLWSAHWGGWRVTRYRPDGSTERELRLPVANVTCMACGGMNLTELFITTAYAFLSEEERAAQPLAGDVFVAAIDVPGLPEPAFAG
jgi:sugar lactone lactonase YvrE